MDKYLKPPFAKPPSLANIEILEILESLQTLQNEGDSNQFLEILENLGTLRDFRDSSSEKTSLMTPFSSPDFVIWEGDHPKIWRYLCDAWAA